MDSVTSALWIGGTAAVLVILAGGVITVANRDSETIVLGFTAVIGTFALFGAQLFFHLRGSTSEEPVGTQIVINRTAPTANALQPANNLRAAVERDAAEWLAAKSPQVFKDEGNKLARDLLVFSILNYVTADEVDWQMKKSTYDFPALGKGSTTTFFQYQSAEDAYSLTEADIRGALRAGQNLFAEAPLQIVSAIGLRLPRGSRLSVADAPLPSMQTTLTIRNPITRIDFIITPAQMVEEGLRPPKADQKAFAFGQWVVAGFPDADYGLYFMRIVIQASFSATRAHHPDVALHRAWVNRLGRGLGNWFRSENPR